MGKKTPEQLLEEAVKEYNSIVSDIHKFYFTNREKEMFIGIVKHYAEQEVKKHLSIAAEKATMHAIHNGKNRDIVINKESITEIKIELT